MQNRHQSNMYFVLGFRIQLFQKRLAFEKYNTNRVAEQDGNSNFAISYAVYQLVHVLTLPSFICLADMLMADSVNGKIQNSQASFPASAWYCPLQMSTFIETAVGSPLTVCTALSSVLRIVPLTTSARFAVKLNIKVVI